MYFELFAYVRTGRRPVAIGPEISKYMPREPRVHTTDLTVNSPRPLLPLSVHLLGFRVLSLQISYCSSAISAGSGSGYSGDGHNPQEV